MDKFKFDEHLKAIEILTTNKRQLENQVSDLQNKIISIECNYAEIVNNLNQCENEKKKLENELICCKQNINAMSEELQEQKRTLKEQLGIINSLTEKNNDLLEEMDIAKTALVAKQTENACLNSRLNNLQHKLDVTELHLQQLSHGVSTKSNSGVEKNFVEENDLLQKVSNLDHQLSIALNEKEQIKNYYEQCLRELNKQLNTLSTQHSELLRQNHVLCNRESSLIEQISEMEIRMQQFRDSYSANMDTPLQSDENKELAELKEKYKQLEVSIYVDI